MAVGLPLKTTYANGDVYSASDVNDTNGTVNTYLAAYVAGKNAVINGGMDIWQRGTSIAYIAGVAYFADRWNGYRGALATGATFSRQSSGLTGILYCARMARDSGNTSTQPINTWYNLESQDSYKFAGQNIVLSFWARKGADYSATSNVLNVVLAYGTGTDQNLNAGYTGQTNINVGTATLTSSWQRFTFSGSVNSAATQLGFQIYYTPTGTAGAADYVEFTGVQMELGTTLATSFSRAGSTIGGELALCQRYYNTMVSGNTLMVGMGVMYDTVALYIGVSFPVAMRTTPSLVATSGTDYYRFDRTGFFDMLNSVLIAYASTETALLYNSTDMSTSQGVTGIVRTNNASASIAFSAEL